MPCGKEIGPTQRRLTALSNANVVEWFGGWRPCIGLDEVMFVLKAAQASSDYFNAQVVIQVAKVRTDLPEAPALKGSLQTPTSGKFEYNTGVLDVSGDTAGMMFIRFGVAYKYTTGQSQSSADVTLDVAYTQCGDMVGSSSHQLSTTTVEDQYVAITGWLTGILAAEVKAAFVCNSLTGYFRYRLAYRTAATSQEAPSAWTAVTDTNTPYTAGEVNTGDLPVTLGSNMWIQFAILYDLSEAGTGQASVSVAIGVRRS